MARLLLTNNELTILTALEMDEYQTYQELKKEIGTRPFSAIQELEKFGMISLRSNGYHLTPVGLRWLKGEN